MESRFHFGPDGQTGFTEVRGPGRVDARRGNSVHKGMESGAGSMLGHHVLVRNSPATRLSSEGRDELWGPYNAVQQGYPESIRPGDFTVPCQA